MVSRKPKDSFGASHQRGNLEFLKTERTWGKWTGAESEAAARTRLITNVPPGAQEQSSLSTTRFRHWEIIDSAWTVSLLLHASRSQLSSHCSRVNLPPHYRFNKNKSLLHREAGKLIRQKQTEMLREKYWNKIGENVVILAFYHDSGGEECDVWP